MKRFTGHRYTCSSPFTATVHTWELRSELGGVSFHAHVYDDQKYGDSCGLEFHSVTSRYGDAPHHLDCEITGGRCWHEGTSLYATETLWPRFKSFLKSHDHKTIYQMLEEEHDEYFKVGESA